ncbi:hypothetical protein [Deminuibacter soli]|uniref:Uncharacterized protein n=1 Tax=Deminuibacter soli TaxID=2291815 RepID=A0A3E1NH42_9BACT|nr:hypothetical protein [Deminuibacter soli]RFM27255.1 hypothetical protein DXN05_14575 [Deminuibacter soli]
MDTKKLDAIVVRLAKDANITDTKDLRAYAVDYNGNIVETATFDGQDAVIKSAAQTDKIYVGAALPDNIPAAKANEQTLASAGAYQAVMKFTDRNVIGIERLPDNILQFPPFRFCNVTGHVHKNFVINGVNTNLPVCHARVHICNVEKFFLVPIYLKPLPVIPPHLLDDLKGRLAQINQPVLKIPPRPDPGPLREAGVVKQNLALRSLVAKPVANINVSKATAFRQPAAAGRQTAAQQLPDTVLSELQSATVETIQPLVSRYHDILYPYLCLWPIFWPWFYRLEEEAVVETDCSGHFSAWLFLPPNTTENIYVWVEVNIGGNWVTVYRPPFPCYTRWNYACGTDINVQVTDSRVLPCECNPLEGEFVWISNVNNTSLRSIAMHDTQPSLFSDARGLAKGILSDKANQFISPFTGGFPIRVGFGDALPTASITHYRWKYRRIADGFLNPVNESFYYDQKPVSKPYIYEHLVNGLLLPFVGNYQLDETSSAGVIYKIPPSEASIATGDASARWTTYMTDTISLAAADAKLGDGLFEFVLELCDNNGVTQTPGNDVFLVDSLLASPPNAAALPARSIDTDYLFHGVNNTNAADPITGFRFLLRIDNNASACHIDDAVVENHDTGHTGSTADTECGFATYKDKNTASVLLRFAADQLHRYADYSFVVSKGNVGTVASYADQVPPPDNTTTVNSAIIHYQESAPIATLLGTCIHAAFAETLYVTAYHTDGNTRYVNYDRSDVAAFAVEPE